MYLAVNLFQYESQRIDELMLKIKFFEEKEAKSHETIAEYQKEIETQRNKYKEQILALQKQKIQLSQDLDQVCIEEK